MIRATRAQRAQRARPGRWWSLLLWAGLAAQAPIQGAWAEGPRAVNLQLRPDPDHTRGPRQARRPTAAPAPVVELPPIRETLPGFYPENIATTEGQGFMAATLDREFTFRISGFYHMDARTSSVEDDTITEDNVYWRRFRVTADGRLFGPFEYRAMWDVTIDPTMPYDFHLDYRPMHEFNVRVGGFKSVFGLERRSRSYALFFMERSFTSSLSPNRELGLFVYGQTQDGFFSYETAITSGAMDLATSYGRNRDSLGDLRDNPDFQGRIYFQPFRLTNAYPALRQLGLGFSWTYGAEEGAVDDPRIRGVRSMARGNAYGGRQLYRYLGGAFADGQRDRQAAQFHWRHRQLQTNFEYTRSAQRVTRDGGPEGGGLRSRTLGHQAWYGMVSYTLNPNDENTYFGVKPSEPLNLEKGHWGGATVSLRYQELHMDPDAFPHFADPNVSAHTARGLATSLQWHAGKLFEFQLDLEYMRAVGADLPPELSMMLRWEQRY